MNILNSFDSARWLLLLRLTRLNIAFFVKRSFNYWTWRPKPFFFLILGPQGRHHRPPCGCIRCDRERRGSVEKRKSWRDSVHRDKKWNSAASREMGKTGNTFSEVTQKVKEYSICLIFKPAYLTCYNLFNVPICGGVRHYIMQHLLSSKWCTVLNRV